MMEWKTLPVRLARPSAKTLQWGHFDDRVEDPAIASRRSSPSSGFNGATSMIEWKTTAICRLSPPARDRFNGATSMIEWKT